MTIPSGKARKANRNTCGFSGSSAVSGWRSSRPSVWTARSSAARACGRPFRQVGWPKPPSFSADRITCGGVVVPGFQRGAEIGFPTANLQPDKELIPPEGVYAVHVELDGGRWYQGVTNIGRNPTFGNEGLSIEVHVFGLEENLYGERLNILFVERLRDERKFDSIEALTEQIAVDIRRAKEILQEPAGRK